MLHVVSAHHPTIQASNHPYSLQTSSLPRPVQACLWQIKVASTTQRPRHMCTEYTYWSGEPVTTLARQADDTYMQVKATDERVIIIIVVVVVVVAIVIIAMPSMNAKP
ncbi:hypothetical protein SYNPS1DRAFT_26977 [Syncephalis pseudoplumigaleata]|uniref:Uncharacterized protein n=1 Tax=Syncephalis pseudoplumigaleata TaxID=1712513 RepID=A0A4P9Z5K9_9FUNG|nr:hypothetical protein SYNPS1DRAFT_26977 [Syncephalis pseudoplumigaleata]|eukprot:RKP27372.1 hypothetical protein SYNPS1DRAFT_26977 [Syncephalis pseudoplumigaleata]